MAVQPAEITVDGLTLRGNLYTPDTQPKHLAVLFLHGWSGKPNDFAASVLAEKGYYALTVSFRGHNDSDGEFEAISRQNALDDAAVAFDYLAANVPPGTAIVAVGNSFGGYITTLLSTIRPLKAISLRVPATYKDEGFVQAQLGQGHNNPDVLKWREAPQPYAGNRGFEAVHAFTGPVQIIEAELDDLVPHQAVQNYVAAVADAQQLTYHFMHGWPHSLGAEPIRNKQFQSVLLDWLASL